MPLASGACHPPGRRALASGAGVLEPVSSFKLVSNFDDLLYKKR
jgi:hypothetical protein